MKLKIIAFSILPFLVTSLTAQEMWSLSKCVDYAVQNNITVQKMALQTEYQKLNLKTSQWSFVPNLSAGLVQNFSFGRATGNDNITTSQSLASTNFTISTSMPLFSGFRIANQIASDKLNLQAAIEDLNKAKEDLTLNVTAFYLNVLYNKELVNITQEQVKLSEEQVKNTQYLVESGRRSESELYEHKAQLANDQQTNVEASNALRLAILDLCQSINYPDIDNFDIAAIDTKTLIEASDLSLLSLQDAYATSLTLRPSIKASERRIESSKKGLRIAQSAYYPQLDLQAGYNTGYFHAFQLNNIAFGQQLKDNSSEAVVLSLSIPIFNRLASVNRVKQAHINILNQELELENVKQVLLKEIQTAYYNALAAREKYIAATKTSEAARISFEFEQAKYNGGKSTPFDLNNAKTRLEKSLSQETQAKFDFIFRTKIFDFYNGKSIVF
ncbi:MAG TPA: TolC family protein [Paludibacteraceae bacterium]|nr:TolC family protein [Paludibacteraceae bacterium]